MKENVTIKGKPVIEIFEIFGGSYWFVTERAWKQDSLINGKIFKRDQIFFGYVRLSHCPEYAEFGYFSEAELNLMKPKVWKVAQENWALCPEVEVETIPATGQVGFESPKIQISGLSSVWEEVSGR